MDYNASVITRSETEVLGINKVLKNTYLLLSMTLLFAAAMAFVGIAIGFQMNIVALIVFFAGAWFLPNFVYKHAESAAGIPWIFAYTGFLGFFLAPMVGHYLSAGMGHVVMQALAGTALIFLSLSGYVLTTRKNFSFMRGFIFTGIMVLFFGAIAMAVASMFGVALGALSMAFSAAACLLMSGLILWQTSEIIHGGETNYIRATAGLFVAIWSLFANLLSLLGMSGDD